MQLASKAKNLDTEAETVTINIEESLKNVLGKHYHPRKRHRSLPSLQKPQFNQNQVVVYSSLPYKDMDVVVEPRMPSTLAHHGHKASSATLGDTNKNTRKSHAPTPSGTPFKQGFRRPASRESARKHVKVNKSPECLSWSCEKISFRTQYSVKILAFLILNLYCLIIKRHFPKIQAIELLSSLLALSNFF